MFLVADGLWSDWSRWSDCSATCGKGSRTRTRLCDNPVPAGGGQNCTGASVQTDHCGTSEECDGNCSSLYLLYGSLAELSVLRLTRGWDTLYFFI